MAAASGQAADRLEAKPLLVTSMVYRGVAHSLAQEVTEKLVSDALSKLAASELSIAGYQKAIRNLHKAAQFGSTQALNILEYCIGVPGANLPLSSGIPLQFNKQKRIFLITALEEVADLDSVAQYYLHHIYKHIADGVVNLHVFPGFDERLTAIENKNTELCTKKERLTRELEVQAGRLEPASHNLMSSMKEISPDHHTKSGYEHASVVLDSLMIEHAILEGAYRPNPTTLSLVELKGRKNQALLVIEGLKDRCANLETDIETLKGTKPTLRAALDKLTREIRREEASLKESEAKKRLDQAIFDLKEYVEPVRMADEAIDGLKAVIQELEAQLKTAEDALNEVEEQNAALASDQDELNRRISPLTEQVKNVKERHDTALIKFQKRRVNAIISIENTYQSLIQERQLSSSLETKRLTERSIDQLFEIKKLLNSDFIDRDQLIQDVTALHSMVSSFRAGILDGLMQVVSELDSYIIEVSDTRQEYRLLDQSKSSCELELETVKEDIENNKEKIASLEKEKEKIAIKISSNKEAISHLSEASTAGDKEKETCLSDAIRNAQHACSELQYPIDALKSRETAMRTVLQEHEQLKAELASAEDAHTEVHGRYLDAQERFPKLSENIERLRVAIDEKEAADERHEDLQAQVRALDRQKVTNKTAHNFVESTARNKAQEKSDAYLHASDPQDKPPSVLDLIDFYVQSLPAQLDSLACKQSKDNILKAIQVYWNDATDEEKNQFQRDIHHAIHVYLTQDSDSQGDSQCRHLDLIRALGTLRSTSVGCLPLFQWGSSYRASVTNHDGSTTKAETAYSLNKLLSIVNGQASVQQHVDLTGQVDADLDIAGTLSSIKEEASGTLTADQKLLSCKQLIQATRLGTTAQQNEANEMLDSMSDTQPMRGVKTLSGIFAAFNGFLEVSTVTFGGRAFYTHQGGKKHIVPEGVYWMMEKAKEVLQQDSISIFDSQGRFTIKHLPLSYFEKTDDGDTKVTAFLQAIRTQANNRAGGGLCRARVVDNFYKKYTSNDAATTHQPVAASV